MKSYKKLELEIMEFDVEDVILTSGLNNNGDLDEGSTDYTDSEGELLSVSLFK